MSTAFIKQQEILDASIDKKLWALFCEAGTGKTFMAIRTSEHWWGREWADCVLVICPKTLIFGTWIDVELPKHSSIPYNAWGWKSTFTKTIKADLIKKLKDKTKLLYIIVNHDAITSKSFLPVYNTLIKFRKTGFIYDESTAIKSIKTDRAKAAIEMGKAAVFKRIMTGTPITEGPLDVYSQTEFLEEGILGFKSYFSMKTRYCEIRMKKFGARSFPEIIGYRDLDNLYNRLERFSSFLKLKDCVDMPEQVFSSISVEMTAEQETHYKTLRKLAIAWIEEHEVTAVNALALMRKLHQVAVGQMKIDDTTYVSIDNNRLATLKEIMDDVNHQVIIWSVYRNSTLDILKYLGNRAVGISVKHSPEQRSQLIEQWKRGDHQGLVLNQASAAHGLTLIEGLTSVFYSNDFSLERRLQALRRPYRLGQTNRTRVIDLFAPGTVEVGILNSLIQKEEIANIATDKKKLIDLIDGIVPIKRSKM
jgi:SNF2 family DNA or RNA helicase